MSKLKITRRHVLAGIGGGVAVAASGFHIPARAAGSPALVGALNPVSGAGGTYGPGMQKAIIMAAEEINAAGGAAGQQIEIVGEDTQTSPEAAVNAVKKLIEVNNVGCVMGTWSSGVTLAIMPITTEAGVPLMCTSGAPAISTQDEADLVWRFQATNDRFGRAFAKIVEKEGFKRPATMAYNNASGIGNTEGFKKAWSGETVGEVIYEPKRPSYRSELQAIMATDPDVIVMGSYLPDTTIILREWFQLGGTNKWLIPGWAANSKLVEALGAEVTEGVIAVDSVSNENAESYTHFGKLYEGAMGEPASTNVYAAMTYDMMIVWGLAMQMAGANANSVEINAKLRDVANPEGSEVFTFAEGVKALESGPINYQGASSRLDFDEYDDVTPDFGMSVITGGEFNRVGIVKI
jgi:branched-chain amino acid transport system substrate-binding protein